MIGDHLQHLARHVVRDDAYSTIVAPAIADLQHEARLGTWPLLRAYAGAWRALIAAAAQEVAGDTLAVVRAVPLASVLGPTTVTIVALTTLMMAPMIWRETQSRLPWHYDAVLLVLMAPHVWTFVLPAVGLPFAASYARCGRPGAARAALMAAAIVVVLLMGGNQLLNQRLAPLSLELRIAAVQSLQHLELHRRPLWEARKALKSDIDAIAARRPGGARSGMRDVRERHQSLAMLLMGTTFAICGVVWRRCGSVALACSAFGVFVAHAALMFIFTGVLYVQRVSGYAASVWSPVLLLFLTAWLVALRSSEARA